MRLFYLELLGKRTKKTSGTATTNRNIRAIQNSKFKIQNLFNLVHFVHFCPPFLCPLSPLFPSSFPIQNFFNPALRLLSTFSLSRNRVRTWCRNQDFYLCARLRPCSLYAILGFLPDRATG